MKKRLNGKVNGVTESDRPIIMEQEISVVQCMTLGMSVRYTCSGEYTICVSAILYPKVKHMSH